MDPRAAVNHTERMGSGVMDGVRCVAKPMAQNADLKWDPPIGYEKRAEGEGKAEGERRRAETARIGRPNHRNVDDKPLKRQAFATIHPIVVQPLRQLKDTHAPEIKSLSIMSFVATRIAQ